MDVSEVTTVLDLGDRRGHTDYIDFIKQSDVTTSLSKGIDVFRRPFFVLLGIAHFESGDEMDIEVFQTFFQRYTDNDSLWMGCGHHGINLMETSGGMSEAQIELLQELIRNKKVKVTVEDFSKYRIHTEIPVKSFTLSV
jgi:phosphosulfolactate synthase (CoM biosynthesis protein A)